MSQVIDLTQQYWNTSATKMTPSGWSTRNAPCCHHRGETADTKKRGGLIITGDVITYNCFNCKFKCKWEPGQELSSNYKKLLRWLGMPFDDVKKLAFDLWLVREGKEEKSSSIKPAAMTFKKDALPKGAQTLDWWAENDPTNKHFVDALNYLMTRDEKLLDLTTYYLTKEPNQAFRSIIIPFYYKNELVGWTARKIDKTNIRYQSSVQPNFLYNMDCIGNREIILVVEGIFDAINLNCIGTLGSKLSRAQIDWLNSLGKTIIVVPDRDKAGMTLVDIAMQNGWGVSIPENSGPHQKWDDNVKDISDAVKQYGRLYTLQTILDSTSYSTLEIELKVAYS